MINYLKRIISSLSDFSVNNTTVTFKQKIEVSNSVKSYALEDLIMNDCFHLKMCVLFLQIIPLTPNRLTIIALKYFVLMEHRVINYHFSENVITKIDEYWTSDTFSKDSERKGYLSKIHGHLELFWKKYTCYLSYWYSH